MAYSYGDSAWGDLLTSYGGRTITYDAIGNPLSDGIWSYTWEHGRQLASMKRGNTTWTYSYNSSGLRESRSNGSTTYHYIYDGDQLAILKIGGNTLRFAYDANGQPWKVEYNGTDYYYLLNVQGDVVGLANINGERVVSYTYDAWGNIRSTTGSLASTLGQHNPLRYRGYVYDQETKLYYLQSRYYNPEIGRFINADSLMSVGSNILGANVFAYCNNNPVMYSDGTGHLPVWAIVVSVLLLTPVGGMAIQAATSVASYVGAAVGSIFDEEIRSDMNAIGWNMFNSDKSAVIGSNKISFYNGMAVYRTNLERSGSFYAIFLNDSATEETLAHEYGHGVQQRLMGPVQFGLMIGLPSWLEWSERSYYDRPWEVTADIFGGVTMRNHSQEDISRGYWYLGVSSLMGPVGYLFLFGEYGL